MALPPEHRRDIACLLRANVPWATACMVLRGRQMSGPALIGLHSDSGRSRPCEYPRKFRGLQYVLARETSLYFECFGNMPFLRSMSPMPQKIVLRSARCQRAAGRCPVCFLASDFLQPDAALPIRSLLRTGDAGGMKAEASCRFSIDMSAETVAVCLPKPTSISG